MYYVKSDGEMATNEWVDNGKYYVNQNGCLVPDKTRGEWKTNNAGRWYQYDDGSYPVNGWATIDGDTYYFSYNGYMQTGWIMDNGKYYYLDESGKLIKNSWISGMYYVKSDGEMATNEWVDGHRYYVDSSGKKISITIEDWETDIL